MRLINILCHLVATAAAASSLTAEDDVAALETRQSGRTTQWIDGCKPPSPGPNSYRAFDLGNCNHQLTLTRDRGMIGVQFEFEAIYADGSR
jgi:hypothetical protein